MFKRSPTNTKKETIDKCRLDRTLIQMVEKSNQTNVNSINQSQSSEVTRSDWGNFIDLLKGRERRKLKRNINIINEIY